jgi:hypothetical protein
MTTETEYKLMVHDLYVKMEQRLGKQEFLDWWQRNVIALRGIVDWNYKTLFGVLNSEYQCLKRAQDQLFCAQYAEDVIRIKEWQQQARDERPV